MKYLNLRWINSQDSSQRALRISDPKDGLTQDEVTAFMQKVASTNLLQTSKNSMVDTVDSATIVDTTSTELFNLIQ
jgi:hypothetical protein